MNPSNAQLAEAADRRWYLMSAAMLLIGLKAAVSAAMAITAEPYLRYLDWTEAGLALAAVAIMLWVLVYKFARVPSAQRHRFLHLEGYVKSTIQRAGMISWSSTFVLLAVLAPASRRFSEVPSEFFLHGTMAVMLSLFSIAFFVLNRSDDDEGVADA